MPWERRTKKRPHECNRPDAWSTQRRNAEVGDIWRCRKCGTRWELTYKGIPSTNLAGPMHENAWQKIATPPKPGVPREPKPRPAKPKPQIPGPVKHAEPPRQTGTGWCYTVPEKHAR